MPGEIIGRREELLAIEAMLVALPAGGPARRTAPRQQSRLACSATSWAPTQPSGA